MAPCATPIERLALSLPALRLAPGVQPWEAQRLDVCTSGPSTSEAALHAAPFVLAVWDRPHPWRSGRLDAVVALSLWGVPHRGAFLTWVARPWWA
jgi:hypothetical protein